ncbi:unnamed protein product [Lactuca saligna]|uniref:SWIM-type domain-containing protein n=1 Tax=Lactuca saligna TaxID=75948 RepID=A0AA35ZTU8_LACSI|nr:unnamed protein product [Lactuca saligna]
MASTSGTKKPKGPKLPEKTYLPDSDSDEDAFDFSFLDFSEETFKAPSRLCDDQFLNLLCDENVLRRSIDGMVDDGDIPGVQQKEHAHLDEDNEDVGVEPNIQLNLNEFGKDMRLWIVVPSGGDVFETRYGYNGYKVDLANHTCPCNLWRLSGIPCVDSQAAINYVHKDPSEFISSWFHKDKYVATYIQNIQPVGGSNLWPVTEFIKPLPPLVRRMPGRPKVNRVKHASELEDAKYPSQRLKVTRTVRCGKCQQLGHNKISCTNDEVPKPPVPKRKIGRPRKDGGG